MPEVAAAIGLAQLEKVDLYVKKRIDIAKMYLDCIYNCEWLVPQTVPNDYLHSYWTFAVKMINPNINWQDFRIKYIENGGDGIFAAWKVVYEEPFLKNGKWKKHAPDLYDNITFEKCKNAETLQKQLMQFVNNYETNQEAEKKVSALYKTIKYFD